MEREKIATAIWRAVASQDIGRRPAKECAAALAALKLAAIGLATDMGMPADCEERRQFMRACGFIS